MSFKLLKKIVSIFTLAAFMSTNIAYAAPDSKSVFKNKKINYQKISDKNDGVIQKKKAIMTGEDKAQSQAQREVEKKILSSHLSDLSLIHIPEELGKVVEVYQNPDQDNSKLVVHIQDLHTNPEASLNLAKILDILLKDYKMGLVCSEGADGVVDTSSVSSFPDANVREKVARLFIDSGELTGEEYLSITKYPELPIWGIENKEIYFKNIVEFNNIMKFNPGSQVFISQVKKALEDLKPKIYSKELLAIDQKEFEYDNQKIETADYLKHLSSYIQKLNIPTANYKNIALLDETMNKESKIDQQKIMQESQNLLLNLQSVIAGKSNRSDMDTLMAKASLFKDKKISPFSFYSYLKDLATKHLKDQLSKYSNLMDFVDYLTKVNSLDSTKLFTEMGELTYEIKQKLARNDEEKALTQNLRNIKFLDGFFNLKVSNEELDYYLENRDSHKAGYFESFLKPAIKKYNISSFVDFNPDLIDSHLQEIEDFYKTAKSRDLVMFNNSISEIEKRNIKVSALITGGFHTKGLTRLLKDRGYSYIVISPYSKTEIDEENYHFLLSGKRKPIEELIKQLDLAKATDKVSKNLRVPMTFDPDMSSAGQDKGKKGNELTRNRVGDAIKRIGGLSTLGSNDSLVKLFESKSITEADRKQILTILNETPEAYNSLVKLLGSGLITRANEEQVFSIFKKIAQYAGSDTWKVYDSIAKLVELGFIREANLEKILTILKNATPEFYDSLVKQLRSDLITEALAIMKEIPEAAGLHKPGPSLASNANVTGKQQYDSLVEQFKSKSITGANQEQIAVLEANYERIPAILNETPEAYNSLVKLLGSGLITRANEEQVFSIFREISQNAGSDTWVAYNILSDLAKSGLTIEGIVSNREQILAIMKEIPKAAGAGLNKPGPSLASNATVTGKQQVDSMDQIIVVSAESVIANKEGFKVWRAGLPGNNAVVIIATSEQYNSVEEFENITYIKVIGRDIDQEYGAKLTELFAVYGNSEFFGGFKLGTPANLDEYKTVASQIAKGV